LTKTTAPLVLLAACGVVQAQSLFVRQPTIIGDTSAQTTPELATSSLFYVSPSQPKSFSVHDIIHVIVNETSSASSSQSLETTKETTQENDLNSIIDPLQLLELRLQAAAVQNLSLLDLETSAEFTGEGQYDRSDQLRARIAAEVVDVKPNGTLILHARKTVGTDEERQTITLTGTARSQDITEEDTILSSQLANLEVGVVNEGEVRKGAKKGVITKALEWLFNF